MNDDIYLLTCPLPPGSVVGAYYRDSGWNEQEGSITQQDEVGRLYCQRHGLVYDENLVFSDSASGKRSENRNDFNRMISMFEKKPRPCQGLLLWSRARFARNLNDTQYYMSMLKRMGYTIISLSGDVPDVGKLTPIMETVVDWKNEQYLDDMRKEIIRGIYKTLNKGAWSGDAPVGFRREPINLGVKRNGKQRIASRLVIDDAVMPRVVEAFKLRALRKTIREVHEATKLFNAKNRSMASSYTKMFVNPIYIGKRRQRGELLDYVPAAVPLDLWERVQNVTEQVRAQSGANHRRSSSNTEFSLNGLVKCDICGGRMHVQTVHCTQKRRRNPIEYTYRFYYCSVSDREPGHNHNRINADSLEKAVLGRISTDVLTANATAELEAHIREQCDTETVSKQKRITDLKAELKMAEGEITNIGLSLKQAPLSVTLITLLTDAEARAKKARELILASQEEKPARSVEAFRITIEQVRAAFEGGQPREIRCALQELVAVISAGPTLHIEYQEF